MNKPVYSGHPINTDGTTAVNRMYVEGEKNMRKNRTARFIFNGALLAVMAVLGVTAYQVSNKQEHIQGMRLPLKVHRKTIRRMGNFLRIWNSGRGNVSPG